MARRLGKTQAFLSLILLAATAPLAAHDAQPPPRTISVSGQGEVSAEPDRARLTLGVEKLAPQVKAAETEVNAVVREYLAQAKALGTKEKDIQTTGVQIQPEYHWDEKRRERVLTGYRVSREITVLVKDLDRLGDYILRATAAGVNNVNPPALESSKAAELEDRALVEAAGDARRRARLLADTLDVRLGPARSVSSHQSHERPPIMMKAMARAADMGGNTEMGISLGEIRYRATVQAEFDLVP